MMLEDRKPVEIDPDFFDVLLQSLSVLSNVATMASTWILLRHDRNRQKVEHNVDALRTSLRLLRRHLEDCFEAAKNVLRILESAYGRTGNDLLQTKPKFGLGIVLNQEEFNQVSQQLNQLEPAVLQARQQARAIQNLIQYTDLPEADHINFDVDLFNADLNSILFESATLGEAMTKLGSLQQRAEDFVSDVSAALRRN
jgi:hypothetical protein